MSENFEMIFNRGKNMSQLSSLSTTLREDASKVRFIRIKVDSLKKMHIN